VFFHRTLGAVFGLRPLFLPPPDLVICYRFTNIGAFVRARFAGSARDADGHTPVHTILPPAL